MEKIGRLFMALFSPWPFDPAAVLWRELGPKDAGTVEKGFFQFEHAFDYFPDNKSDKNNILSRQLSYGLTD
jgi:hypothetical protein